MNKEMSSSGREPNPCKGAAGLLEYKSIEELVQAAEGANEPISRLVLEDQAQQLDKATEEVYKKMEQQFRVMKESAASGLHPALKSNSGLSGGSAHKLEQAALSGRTICGGAFGRMLAKALAVSELNACMGRIVAAPTAGSCGIIPSVLLTFKEENGYSEEAVVMSLFTAAAVGMVIARKASISGAEGGCQAECGSASAMAAAALVELGGGSPRMVSDACAIALKNQLGLVCDPVAGLVEVPCVKRNAAGAANALVAAELALAGISSAIPADEVIHAMKHVGGLMSPLLKETSLGGLATTETAKDIEKRLRT